MNLMEELVLYFALKYNGNFQSIYEGLLNKECVDEDLKRELFEKLKNTQYDYTTIFSEDYPKKLKLGNCPPFVLFYKGNLSLVNNEIVAIDGTIVPDEYGIYITRKFVNGLVERDKTIVSGTHKGIEEIVINETTKGEGKRIVVLENGFKNECFDKNELFTNTLMISEYPFGNDDLKSSLFSKRIIAGLSDSLLITQCGDKEDVHITVAYVLEQGKDVYAIPCNIGDLDGCNYLIKNGAIPTLSCEDLSIEEGYELE